MTAYYNEFDPFAAQWLRNLIDANLIAPGVVDDRSITDVTASDLRGFTQCHFFAGIGGWSLALRLAGVPDTYNCWTGSPPCQPFSTAGKQLGQLDDRHLAPTFMRLVSECQPPVIFGEQVAAAIKKHWLDDLFIELERQGYACGAAVLPACSVGAPHKRDRLFFGACSLVHPNNERECSASNGAGVGDISWTGETFGRLAQSMCTKWDGQRLHRPSESDGAQGGRETTKPTGCSYLGSMAYPNDQRPERKRAEDDTQRREESDVRQAGLCDGAGAVSADPHHVLWSDTDWLGCRDGKFRQVESGTFPLADGVPARVGRLRGYGNAIVPQVASAFITAFMASAHEVIK